jgi:DNA polymerase III subunit delta'
VTVAIERPMWRGILEHDEIVERFRQTLEADRLASTYLFVGPAGIGKRRFAKELAGSLLCTEAPESALAPCGKCESCRLFAAGNHPDFEIVGLPPEKSSLPIAIFIGDDQHRNQEGLCHRIAFKPFYGRRKVAIVDDADHFSIPSANCLLKTLEEPPESALLILIGTSPSRQLPTIRSRSQVVRFAPLSQEAVEKILIESGAITDPTRAARAAELGGGSVERALQMADPALGDYRRQLISDLTPPLLESARLARSLQAFIDEAGKEASLRRERLRIVIGFAIDQFRAALCEDSDAQNEVAVESLDACLASLEHIDRNANLGMVIQHWCEELAAAKVGKRPSRRLSAV